MKILFISDTHNKHHSFNFSDEKYSEVETIVHSGDFSHNIQQFDDFMIWYSELPFKNKIIIPGNHEELVQEDEEMFYRTCKELNIIGLIDKEVVIDGIKFYGSSWTPMFYDWAYMKEDYLLDQYWDKIPNNTNVLITHGPSYGILDTVCGYYGMKSVGSKTLADTIDRLKELKIHTFGHIHEGRGKYKENKILRINASSVDRNYEICEPYIIDYNNIGIV